VGGQEEGVIPSGSSSPPPVGSFQLYTFLYKSRNPAPKKDRREPGQSIANLRKGGGSKRSVPLRQSTRTKPERSLRRGEKVPAANKPEGKPVRPNGKSGPMRRTLPPPLIY